MALKEMILEKYLNTKDNTEEFQLIEALAEAVERSDDLSQAMPPNAVSMELHRSIKKLKQKLEEL